jgi:serine protease
MNRLDTQLLFSFLLATFVITACGGGGSSGGGTPTSAAVSGTVEFVPAGGLLTDVEPNDSFDQPQPLGVLRAGGRVIVRGTVGGGGGGEDPFDAFAFVAPERVRVRASIAYAADPAREIQLGAYDPVALRVVARDDAHALDFHARGAFDVVVRSARGSGAYTLTVRAEAASSIEGPGWIGDVAVGDAIALRLAGAPATGASRWLATSAESQALFVRAITGSAQVRDASRDGAPLLAQVPAGQERRIELAPLQFVEITADVGTSIDLRSEALTSAQQSLVLAGAPSGARAGSLELERSVWNAGANEPLYGRPALEARLGELFVLAKNGADLAADFARRGLRYKDRIPGDAILVEAELPPTLDAAERLRATTALARSFAVSPRVEYAELNLVRHVFGGPVTPTDQFFHLQWHYDLINLPQAWGVFSPQRDAIVAVIDTGKRAHPDLDANQTIQGFDFISDNAMAGDGNGIDNDPTDVGDGQGPTASSFHGTHVAGTIAAVTSNGTLGVSGVCGPLNRTKIMHLRALGIGGGSDFDIAQAIRYAAGLANSSGTLPARRADVINMSLGGPGSSQTMQNTITAARDAGVTIFAAAGNNNSSTPFFPAAYDGVISVSAVDINSNKAPYSNFNATVDLCAPGGDTSVDLNNDGFPDGVLSTLVDVPNHDPIYVFYQGTSMACPHAAGVAALMVSHNPSATPLTPTQIETILKSTAHDLGAPGQDPIFGAGLIDAYQALLQVGNGVPLTPVLTVSPTSLGFGTQVTTLSIDVSNGGGGSLDITSADVNTLFGGPWLSAVTVASNDPSTNISRVTVTVDRTGLADSDYLGSVTIQSSNGGGGGLPGQFGVTVMMSVATPTAPLNEDLFLLAVKADTLETVRQVLLNPTTTLAFAMADLPNGDYIIVCGSDDDHDNVICGPGDLYCGAYPTADQPQVVTVSGHPLANIDFTVGPTAPAGAGAGNQAGFRLLR